MALEKLLYTATATASGGRAGTAKSDDGRLSVNLSLPKAMGGDDGPGTNPEQLFAAGYSACFLGAIKAVSGKLKIQVPADTSITSKVSFGPYAPGGFNIQVDMAVTLPGLSKDDADKLVTEAHKICPYSNATRNNVDVNISVA